MRYFGQGLLKLAVNKSSGKICFASSVAKARFEPDSDFFRMYLDDDDFKEIPVGSRGQAPAVTFAADRLLIHYSSLAAADGNTYDIDLDITVLDTDAGLLFETTLVNRDARIRINEVQCPFLQACSLGGPRQKDILYYPGAFGIRMPDPWTNLDRFHSTYMFKDDQGIWFGNPYPGTGASMAWMGVQSGSHFFYLAQHDPLARICVPAVGRNPRGADPFLCLTISSFPALLTGETEQLAPKLLAAWPGDWQAGSRVYRAFIEKAFYKPQDPPAWVKEFAGWQRIIMKHQYGEILYRYDDLPGLYRQGKPAGLNTLLVFGWWKGRFDNSYPHYEPDDKMGGAAKLRQAIADIQADGGRVILYTNGCLIDLQSPYYKGGGNQAAMIDVDHNEYRDHYQFAGEGMMIRKFGYKSFALGCMATESWAERLVDQGNVMKQFAPDSIFYDQIAGHPTKLCFNADHPHGTRVDRDWSYRPAVFQKMRDLCEGDMALGTENISDIGCAQADYTHNSANVKPDEAFIFPYLFRHTLPEIITTNRTIQEEYPGFKDDLTYAFIFGLRYCVSIYRCRGHLGMMPEYTRHLAHLNELRLQYREYLIDGRFTADYLTGMPDGLFQTAYLNADGSKLLRITWNRSGKTLVLDGRTMSAGSLDFAETTI